MLVQKMQEALNVFRSNLEKHEVFGPLVLTGVLDTATVEAIKCFQAWTYRKQDGLITQEITDDLENLLHEGLTCNESKELQNCP